MLTTCGKLRATISVTLSQLAYDLHVKHWIIGSAKSVIILTMRTLRRRMAAFDKTFNDIVFDVRIAWYLSMVKGKNKNKWKQCFASVNDVAYFARDVLRAGCKAVVLVLSRGCDWNVYHKYIDRAALSGTKFCWRSDLGETMGGGVRTS